MLNFHCFYRDSYDHRRSDYFQTVALHHKKKKAPSKAHTPTHGKLHAAHAAPHAKHRPVHRLRHRSKPSRRIISNPDEDFDESKVVDPTNINESIDESESVENAKTTKKSLTTSEEFDRVRLSDKLVPSSRGSTSKKKKNKKSNGSINVDKCLKENSKGDKLDYKAYLSCVGCCDKGTVREKGGILDRRDLPKGYKSGDTITRSAETLADQDESVTEAPTKDGYFSRMGRYFKNLFTWSSNDDDGGQKDVTGQEEEENE